VEFDNAFIYLKGGRNAAGGPNTIGPNNSNGAGIQGGFATRFGSLYLGFGFDTNLWDGEEIIKKVDGDPADEPANPPEDAITFDGAFGVLLGTGNIGAFKLTLDFNQVYLDTNKNDDPAQPDETNNSGGSLLIDLGWGKNFEFKGGALAPEIHIAYQISTYKKETKGPDTFSYVETVPPAGWDSRPDELFDSMSHLVINPGAEYTSASGAHWFAVDYALDIGIHPATIYKDAGGKEYDWKGYDVVNALSGQYTRSVDLADRFALVFGGGLNLELRSSKADYTDLSDPGEYVDFSVDPYINIGATYDFVKKPFQLYSALQLDSSTSTSGNFYRVSYAKWANPKEETYTHTFAPWGLSAGLGLKFSPFENFILDIGLSENLTYYLTDDLKYNWSWDIFDWSAHPFTAALQATVKF
jgi:hypothetical protein